jgi:predicted transcriptional regulator
MALVLWGYLKRKVFISKPRTIEELSERINEDIAAIQKQMTRRLMENR